MTSFHRRAGTAAGILTCLFVGVARAEKPDAGAERARERAEVWLKTLARPDPLDRFLAAWNLEALAPQSTELLVPVVEKRKLGYDSLVSAIQALGEIGAAPAADALAALARDSKQPGEARIAALVALAKLGAAAQDPLAAIAGEEVSDETGRLCRCAAFVAIGMRGDPVTVPLVEKVLAGQDAELRRAAFRAIGYLKDRRFVPHATKALADENPLVLAEAARALGRIGDPASADKVEAALKKAKNPAVRAFLVEALAWHGKKAAVDELLANLGDPESHLQASSAGVLIELGERRSVPIFREVLAAALERGSKVEPGADLRAAYALGTFGDKESGELLVRALEKGSIELRREAAPALGAIRHREGLTALRAALRDKDRQLRSLALLALGDVGDTAATDDLTTALEDKDPVIRYSACVGLGVLGNRRAIPALKGVAEDDHDFVARASREAIARLEERPTSTPDPRSPLVLQRLRALEREYVLRVQLGGLFQALSLLVRQPGLADVYAKVIVGYETAVDSCGGAHPTKTPITELKKVVDNSKARGRADLVNDLTRQHLEESYRLAKLRADADAELRRQKDGSGK